MKYGGGHAIIQSLTIFSKVDDVINPVHVTIVAVRARTEKKINTSKV